MTKSFHSPSPMLLLLLASSILLLACDVQGLLSTYNFHQPVQLNRLFKTDPRQQMALIENGAAASYYQEPIQPVPAEAPKEMSGAPQQFYFSNSGVEQQQPKFLPRSLDSLDLYAKMFPLFRRGMD